VKNLFKATLWIVCAMVTPAQLIAQEPDRLPEADFSLPLSDELVIVGAHGELIVTALLSPDHIVTEIVVEQSTGSVELDEYAISYLRLNGMPDTHSVSRKLNARLTIKLYSFTMDFPIGGGYHCQQAVRDFDWYMQIHGENADWSNPLISFYGGASILTDRPEVQFLRNPNSRRAAIHESIAACRNRPESLFLRELLLAGNSAGGV
jgi:hypothetical protein